MKRTVIASFAIVSSFAGLLVGSLAHADPMFISDKLVVNVYAEANQDSEKVATIDSGDAVDADEKSEGYTHVKLTNGREGWVKSSYLTAQAPAIVRVKELEKERTANNNAVPPRAAEELKQLQEQNTALRTEVENLKKTAATAHARPAPEQKEPAPTIVYSDPPSDTQLLKWSAATALGGILIGFALGYRAIANRIKRKYGNLKIY